MTDAAKPFWEGVAMFLFFKGVVVAHGLPLLLRWRHVKRQDRILDRCRAAFIVGIEHARRGDDADANRALRRVRNMEALWRYGNSIVYRTALAIYVISISAVLGALMRAGCFWIWGISKSGSLNIDALANVMRETWALTVGYAVLPIVFAIVAWLQAWTKPEVLTDCGNRLEASLNSGSSIVVAEREPDVDDEPKFDAAFPLPQDGATEDRRARLPEGRRWQIDVDTPLDELTPRQILGGVHIHASPDRRGPASSRTVVAPRPRS